MVQKTHVDGTCKQGLRSIHTEGLRHHHSKVDGQQLLTGTVMGRMGCIRILSVNVTKTQVLLSVNRPKVYKCK